MRHPKQTVLQPDLADTRQLLLEAAAEIFASKGFNATTIREICQQAGANVAAVNYHFRDKEGLYKEVLRHTQRQAEAVHPFFRATATGSAEQQLRDFVRSYLRRIFDEGPHSLHGKLVAREMIEPTNALDLLVDEEIRPLADHLRTILRQLLGQRATEEKLRFCGMSVVSQCLVYHHCKSVIARLFPDMKFGPTEIEKLTEHITQFSLAGIQKLA